MARREFSDAEKTQFAADRREQLEQWQAKLTEQVTDLVNGDQWQRWLEVASRFTPYSFRNSLMIMMQRPDATAVAGFQAWRTSFGRKVNKGEIGIRILAPVTKKVEKVGADGRAVLDASGKPALESRVVGFRLATVFDVSQTSGPPLPKAPRPTLLTGQAPPGLWEGLQRFVEAQGFSVTRGDCGGANGITYFDAKQVRVRPDLDDAAAVKTLAHEAGHVVLHDKESKTGQWVCRGTAEVEAESVAYLVTRAHGLDSSQYTFNYVAGWADRALAAAPKDTTLADVVGRTGARVINAADTILTATQPVRLIDQVTEAMATNIERTIAQDRSNEVTARSGVRPMDRPQPVVSSPVARRTPGLAVARRALDERRPTNPVQSRAPGCGR